MRPAARIFEVFATEQICPKGYVPGTGRPSLGVETLSAAARYKYGD